MTQYVAPVKLQSFIKIYNSIKNQEERVMRTSKDLHLIAEIMAQKNSSAGKTNISLCMDDLKDFDWEENNLIKISDSDLDELNCIYELTIRKMNSET